MKTLYARQNFKTIPFFLLFIAVLFSYAAFPQSTIRFVRNEVANPLKSFAVVSGRQSHPAFVDIDGDGDLDCFSGEFNYSKLGMVSSHLFFYKNTGDAKHPLFTEMKDARNPLTAVAITGLLLPCFADIDGDGDEDCFVADNTGAISFYENKGTAKQAKFEKQSAAFNPLSNVKFADIVISQFILQDADKDGDIDCLLTDADGAELYYQNRGSATAPKFVRADKTNDPFTFINNIVVRTLSCYDWNKDGSNDLFINAAYYQNNYGRFSAIDAASGLQNEDAVATCFVDLNNDGTPEMVSGTSDGKFVYNTVALTNTKAVLSLVVSPNPTTKNFTLYLPSSNEETTVQVVNESGKVISAQVISNNHFTFGDGYAAGIYFVQVYAAGKKTGEVKVLKM